MCSCHPVPISSCIVCCVCSKGVVTCLLFPGLKSVGLFRYCRIALVCVLLCWTSQR